MKKILAYFILLFTVFSCGNKENTQKELRVGMEVAYAPFNWYQVGPDKGAVKISSGYANGYDVQIAKLIAKKLNRKLVIVPSDWNALLGPALNSNKVDIVIDGMSPTPERKKSLLFSTPYYSSDLLVVVKKGSKYANAKSIQDFNGAKITAQINTENYKMIDQMKGVKKQVAMQNFPEMIVALNSGKIDGYIAEKPAAIAAQYSNPNLRYIEFSKGNGFKYNKDIVDVAIAMKKSNTELLKKVNEALAEISPEQRKEIMDEAIHNEPLAKDLPEGSTSVEDTKTTQDGFLYWTTNILKVYWPKYLHGTLITLFLAIFGTIVGTFIGTVVAIVDKVNTVNKGTVEKMFYSVLKAFNKLYVAIFRGTPMIVQAMIFYYGLGQVFGINLQALTAALIVISINTGAYISEIIRAGIESIDKGQYDATEALGFTHRQAMQYVILPQAIRNVLPAIGNEFIINIKDSAVLFAIGVTELYTVSQQIAGTNFKYYEVFIITCIIYFVLTTVFSRLFKFIEKKMDGDMHFELIEMDRED